MKKIIIYLLVFSSFDVCAQLNKVIPPSPNMQAFQKYGDIPVSPYTGLPNISIPLYDIKYKDIDLPISISYHASGIKVSEEASQVGLGWVINAGGSISRNIVGEDDFLDWTYFNGPSNNIMDFAGGQGPRDLITQGCILNMFNRSVPNLPTLYTYDLSGYVGNGYDFQPDQYYFNLPNQSGKFILKRNKEAVLEKEAKIQITCTANDGSTWQVRTNDGYLYDFGVNESYHDLSDHYSGWYLTKITSPTGVEVTFHYTQGSRYVKTIGSYSEFWDYYDFLVPSGDGHMAQGQNMGHQQGAVPGKNYSLVTLDYIDFPGGSVKFNYSDRLDLDGEKKLDKLTVFSKDENGVLYTTPFKTIDLGYGYFDHGNSDDDIGGANGLRLKLQSVQESGVINGVTNVSSPYTFSYNESVWLPSKGSFGRDHWGYYNGVANTQTLIPSVVNVSSPDIITSALGLPGPERETAPLMIGAYSLSKIKYPSGGSTDFEFESNDFDEQQSQVNDNSYFNKTFTIQSKTATLTFDNMGSRTLSPSDTLDLSDEYIFSGPGGTSITPIFMNVSFRFSSSDACTTLLNPFPSSGLVTFEILSGTQSMLYKDAAYFNRCSSGGTLNDCLSCGGPVFTYNIPNLLLPPGKFLLKVHVDPSYVTNMPNLQDIRFNFTYSTQVSSTANYNTPNNITYSSGGGQRVRRIIDHEADGSADLHVKKFIYHYFEDKNGSGSLKEYSYGRRMSHPVYNYFVVTDELDTRQAGGVSRAYAYTAPHLIRTADSNIPLNGSAAGAVVGYDFVTVLNGENGENGKTVYKYINDPDHVAGYNDLGWNLPIQPPYGSNLPETLNGSLLEQDDYVKKNGQFVITKATINTYERGITNDNIVYGLENRSIKTNNYLNGSYIGGGVVSPCERLFISYEAMHAQFKPLKSTLERIYNQNNGGWVETATNYYYDNFLHYLPTRIVNTNSKLETITTFNKYPFDYTISGTATNPIAQGVQNLQQKNVAGQIVEKYIERASGDGSNKRVTSATFNTFKASLPVLEKVSTTNTSTPITNFIPANITATNAITDSRYQPLMNIETDDSGNIIEQQRANGPVMSYLWGYNKMYPVAEVKNASSNEVFYNGFEETNTWDTGVSALDAAFKHSGLFSGRIDAGSTAERYSMSNTWLAISLTQPKSYHYSGWIYSNGPSADIYLFMKRTGEAGYYSYIDHVSTIVTGKWVYVEKDFPVPADVTQLNIRVDNNGTLNGGSKVWFDDIRLYPSDAQMATYTYTPLVGVTSTSDAKGQTTYYEYDGLQRLMTIRDQDGNILKRYDYHYRP